MKLPPRTPLDGALARFVSEIDSNTRTSMRGVRAHLFGRIHPPGDLVPGESFQVDLAAPAFVVTWGGEVVSRLTAQLVGTWSAEDGSFLWGFENPSIDPKGTKKIAGWIRQQEELATIAAAPRFDATEDEAKALAGYVTARSGRIGPYPATLGEVRAFVAVQTPDGSQPEFRSLVHVLRPPQSRPSARGDAVLDLQ